MAGPGGPLMASASFLGPHHLGTWRLPSIASFESFDKAIRTARNVRIETRCSRARSVPIFVQYRAALLPNDQCLLRCGDHHLHWDLDLACAALQPSSATSGTLHAMQDQAMRAEAPLGRAKLHWSITPTGHKHVSPIMLLASIYKCLKWNTGRCRPSDIDEQSGRAFQHRVLG